MARFADADKRITSAATARVLILDIERLPGMVPIFDQRTSGYIPVYKWTRLPSLLCFAAKWYGKRKPIEFLSAWDDPELMVRRAWELYDEADIVVGYNQIRFDNRHLKSEWLMAGLPPPSPWKNVDLFAVNRSTFGFESKSLQHLCDRLGLPGKSGHYDPATAERCMAGDVTAQRLMTRYNRGDVRITEAAYDALRPWITNHPHMSTLNTVTCNRCASADLTPQPKNYRANVLEYAAYRCNNCGATVAAGHVRRVARTRGVKDQ
jgi:hypothetical protein